MRLKPATDLLDEVEFSGNLLRINEMMLIPVMEMPVRNLSAANIT